MYSRLRCRLIRYFHLRLPHFLLPHSTSCLPLSWRIKKNLLRRNSSILLTAHLLLISLQIRFSAKANSSMTLFPLHKELQIHGVDYSVSHLDNSISDCLTSWRIKKELLRRNSSTLPVAHLLLVLPANRFRETISNSSSRLFRYRKCVRSSQPISSSPTQMFPALTEPIGLQLLQCDVALHPETD